jgi:hypothetical protein
VELSEDSGRRCEWRRKKGFKELINPHPLSLLPSDSLFLSAQFHTVVCLCKVVGVKEKERVNPLNSSRDFAESYAVNRTS